MFQQQARMNGRLGTGGVRPGGRQRGQAMVEVALLLPVMLLLAMIAAAGSQMLSESVMLRTSAREGAIAASSWLSTTNHNPLPAACNGSNITSVQQCAAYRAQQAGAPTTATVTVTQSTGANSGVAIAQVTVSDTIHPAVGFFGARTLSYAASAVVP